MTFDFVFARSDVAATLVDAGIYPAVLEGIVACAVVLFFLQSLWPSPAIAKPLVIPSAMIANPVRFSFDVGVICVSFTEHIIPSTRYIITRENKRHMSYL